MIRSVETGEERDLSPESLEMAVAQAYGEPRWSPDGERLAVVTFNATAVAPRLSDPASLASTRVRVLDRDGQVLFDAGGFVVGR